MLELVLTNGGIRARKVGRRTFNDVSWPKTRYTLPCNQYAYEPPTNLPPIEQSYKDLKKEGFSDSAILTKLINIYVPWRLFNVGHLEEISTITGFLGHRGSCKTSSAVFMILFDYLIRGKAVYSNIDIRVRVRYRDLVQEFHNRPWEGIDMIDLDDDCRGGVILSDEVNIAGGASAQQHMSHFNTDFNKQIQQLRKRELNFVWTTQRWQSIDAGFRDQADWVILCRDCYNDHSYAAKMPGDKVKWTVCEMSGLSGAFDEVYELEHKYLKQYEVWAGMQWLRPFSWPAYNTYQEQKDDASFKYKLKKSRRDEEQKNLILEARQRPERDIVRQILDSEIDLLWADALWAEVGADRGQQIRIGQMLSEHFDRKRDPKSRRYYYIKKGEGNGNGEWGKPAG